MVFLWCAAAVGVHNGLFGAQIPGFVNVAVQFAGLRVLAMVLPAQAGSVSPAVWGVDGKPGLRPSAP